MVCTVATKLKEKGENTNNRENADFETAISLTGYGKYNYRMLLTLIPAAWATMFDSTTMSYILPSAECDLDLSNFDKGVLNGVVFGGMILSAFFWGFLSDTLGRRKLLLRAFYLLTAIVAVSSFSQAFWVLVVFKFLGGFISCGTHAVLFAYLAEFTGSQHRARLMMILGMFLSLSFVVMPAIAWVLIPQPWSWSLFGGYITFNSWRVFLLVTGLPSLLAGFGLWFFDESPKFLMSSGQSEEALRVFRRVYSINTGNPPETYPVASLVKEQTVGRGILTPEEVKSKSISFLTLLKVGIKQMKPFFHKPHAWKAVLVFTLMFGGLGSQATIRLWLPQLLATVEEYFTINEYTSGNATFCVILALRTRARARIIDRMDIVDEPCVPAQIGDTMYLYSVIIGVTTAVFNISASSVINCLGKKIILVVGYLIGSCCVIAMYWSYNMEILLVLASLFVGAGSMCTNALTSVVVDLFPTSLRTMAVSLTMMFGRVGALTGNLIFPVFLEISCLLPFFLIGGVLCTCSCLTALLSKTTGKPLD